jgi:hypothetical protein
MAPKIWAFVAFEAISLISFKQLHNPNFSHQCAAGPKADTNINQ